MKLHSFKKRLVSLLLVVLTLPLSMLFVGCEYKTYEFMGIVDEKSQSIIPYEEITDETMLANLETYEGSTITLRHDNTCTRTIVSKLSNSSYYTFTENGTYEREDKLLTIYVTLDSGRVVKNQQQYIDGKIIYYDGHYMLVYA